MTFDYESWLKQAQDQLDVLYQQRAAIDEEIAALQRGIEGFSPLVKKASPWSAWNADVLGITDAVKLVFTAESHRCFSPTSIRDVLVEKEVKLTQQNPLATIHQIISRLLERGFIKTVNIDGRTLYVLNHQKKPATRRNARTPKRNLFGELVEKPVHQIVKDK